MPLEFKFSGRGLGGSHLHIFSLVWVTVTAIKLLSGTLFFLVLPGARTEISFTITADIKIKEEGACDRARHIANI